jgi:hypothetical protein
MCVVDQTIIEVPAIHDQSLARTFFVPNFLCAPSKKTNKKEVGENQSNSISISSCFPSQLHSQSTFAKIQNRAVSASPSDEQS